MNYSHLSFELLVVRRSSGTRLALAEEERGRHYKGFISMDLLIFALASLTLVIVVSVMR